MKNSWSYMQLHCLLPLQPCVLQQQQHIPMHPCNTVMEPSRCCVIWYDIRHGSHTAHHKCMAWNVHWLKFILEATSKPFQKPCLCPSPRPAYVAYVWPYSCPSTFRWCRKSIFQELHSLHGPYFGRRLLQMQTRSAWRRYQHPASCPFDLGRA